MTQPLSSFYLIVLLPGEGERFAALGQEMLPLLGCLSAWGVKSDTASSKEEPAACVSVSACLCVRGERLGRPVSWCSAL